MSAFMLAIMPTGQTVSILRTVPRDPTVGEDCSEAPLECGSGHRPDPPAHRRNEIRHDVCVEQISHQISTLSGTASTIDGKSSSRVASVASNASNDLGGTASMISLSPSLRIMARCRPRSWRHRAAPTPAIRPLIWLRRRRDAVLALALRAIAPFRRESPPQRRSLCGFRRTAWPR